VAATRRCIQRLLVRVNFRRSLCAWLHHNKFLFRSDNHLYGCFSAFFGSVLITGSRREARFVGRLEVERVQQLLDQSIAPSTRVKYTAL
jgi:hypothetical protein